MSKLCPLPFNRWWFLLFSRGVWPEPKEKGRFSVLLLSHVNVYFSSHRQSLSARATAVLGGFLRCPWTQRGIQAILVYNPPLCPRLAQVQPAVKSLSLLYSLWIRVVDYGYMCMVREHTAVFSISSPTARHAFSLYRREAASAPVDRSGRWQSFLCGVTLNYLYPLFSLRTVHWDRSRWRGGVGQAALTEPWERRTVVKLRVTRILTSGWNFQNKTRVDTSCPR